MNNKPSKGISKRFSKGLDEASTARSGLRSTEKILATQRTASVQLKLDDELQLLATGMNKLGGQGPDKEAVTQQFAAVQQRVEQVKGENDELRNFFQEALQEAEKLKHENEELRKLGEDAVLDQQLNKALQETDKLKLAADAYKKELLQQKVTELQAELTQANKRLKVAEEEKTALQAAKGGRRDSLRRIEKRASQPSFNGIPDGNTAASASLQTSTDERQALLSRLQGSEQNRGDLDELLATSAKVLQDAETLETQLAETKTRNAQLQGEVEKLNDTVFSKTFRAPSAWAEREVKYKMEKKDWDTQVERLQGIITKLKAENVEYQNNSKTQQFEDSIQELQQKLKQTESAKVTAERALHGLQLDMRGQVEKYNQLQEARRHQEAMSEDGVGSMIEGFDRQHIGGVQPRRMQSKPAPKQPVKALAPDASSSSTTEQDDVGTAGPLAHVQDVVIDFDSHHIGLQQPSARPQQETDTHLHNQPAPDVTSTQPSSAFAATTSPVQSPTSRPQAAQPVHADSNASAHDANASAIESEQRGGANEASSSPTGQRLDSAGTAVFPPQPSGQSQTSPVASSLQAVGQQAEEEPSVSASEAADAYYQQKVSGSAPVYPPPPTTSQLPQTAQQLSIDVHGETPSYTPADVEHTGQTHVSQTTQQPSVDAQGEMPPYMPADVKHTSQSHVPSSAQQGQHQQEAEATSAAPHASVSNETQAGTDSADAIQASSTQQGRPEVQTSSAPADIEQQSTHSVAAATAEGQRPDASSAAASDSQHEDRGSHEGALGPASGVPEADQLSQAAASSSDEAKQQAKETDRGAGFPVGPLGEESDLSESEEELFTVKDAVKHIVRSTRHSRANSSDKLDQAEPTSSRDESEIQPTADTQPSTATRVIFGDAGHIALPGTSSLPTLATRRTPSSSREANDINGSVTERSESSEAWSEERIRQLEEDKAAIERLWGEHAQENDIGVLKFKLAEFESRCEMYEAQVTKMQRSLERGDTEKAKVEEDLAKAMALTAQGDRQGLAAMRDRLSMVVTGRGSKTSQLEERLKEAEEQLQQSFRERARLEKQRGQLEKELASWSSKLGVNIDLPGPDSVEPSDASGSDQSRKLQRWQSSGSGIAGLNDGEMEVMRLREENEALMDSLVRTKVELAETEGEYLKTKRSLIRAHEKLASMSEKVEQLKQALHKAGVNNSADSPSARSDTSTQPFGTPKSVQASTPTSHL